MPTTTTALAIDDVFRDDTVVVGVTDSPVTLSSTTPYKKLTDYFDRKNVQKYDAEGIRTLACRAQWISSPSP